MEVQLFFPGVAQTQDIYTGDGWGNGRYYGHSTGDGGGSAWLGGGDANGFGDGAFGDIDGDGWSGDDSPTKLPMR